MTGVQTCALPISAVAKGKYVKKVTLTSTMGPGILINESEVDSATAVAA